ncbi:MAG: hypothetical protein RL685_6123 [Pseudomonadota bacterium]
MPEQLSRLRVLIADDDFSTRLLASEGAASQGMDSLEAEDGASALALFVSHRPDLVLLDLRMPNGDGYETCRRIRELPCGKSVPILMMTGMNDAASIAAAYEAGATDFIAKPVNPVLLGHRLRYLSRAASAFRRAQETAERLVRAQRLARIAQWELDLESNCFRWSDEALEIFGLTLDDAADATGLYRWVHEEDRQRVIGALQTREPHVIDYRMSLPDGTERLIHQEVSLAMLSDWACPRLVGTIQDMTERLAAESRAARLAYFDSLTGLPNRAYVLESLGRSLAGAARLGHTLAVLVLDLDLFKRVNDNFGHSAGDALLEQVAQRIRSCIRASDQLTAPRLPLSGGFQEIEGDALAGRFGGDEFVVILPQTRSALDAGTLSRRILDRLAAPYSVKGKELEIQASIGIATFPDNGTTAEELLQQADAAMYHAKERGRNCFQFFDRIIHAQAQRRLQIETSLRAVLGGRDGEPLSVVGGSGLSLHFQPKIELPTGRVTGVEALLRWSTPQGNIPPMDFIPVAEDTGLILPLGRWVLRAACDAALRFPGLRMAVNISPRQFRDPAFVSSVRTVLSESGLAPDVLEIEITEGVVMQDTATTLSTFAELKKLGVRISLDDFGTGYSSLSYLTRFRVDQLKIDRSFVKDLRDQNNEAIVSAIIALSNNLHLDVVVEGVETAEQVDFFRSRGRLELQGYHFARPMPEAQLQTWLADYLSRQPPQSGDRPAPGTNDAPAARSGRS